MKLELKENMYIRTKDGYISQYKYYDTTNAYMEKLLCIPLSNGTFANIEDIVKADYKIIKILEVGDYVNGHEVKDIDYAFDDIALNVKKPRIVPYIDNIKNAYIDNIKSVITHEQMEQMAYKVGD